MSDTAQTGKPGLYERLKAATAHPLAEPILALICFLEAMIVPVFPEVMLAPMILADRRRAWRLATICTVFSVLGGACGSSSPVASSISSGRWRASSSKSTRNGPVG